MKIPALIYKTLPFAYIASGIYAIQSLGNPIGIASGTILVCAGLIVIIWRM